MAQAQKKAAAPKSRAARYPTHSLVVIAAYEKTFSSGKRGWFGQVQDINTGQKFQVIGAVEVG